MKTTNNMYTLRLIFVRNEVKVRRINFILTRIERVVKCTSSSPHLSKVVYNRYMVRAGSKGDCGSTFDQVRIRNEQYGTLGLLLTSRTSSKLLVPKLSASRLILVYLVSLCVCDHLRLHGEVYIGRLVVDKC